MSIKIKFKKLRKGAIIPKFVIKLKNGKLHLMLGSMCLLACGLKLNGRVEYDSTIDPRDVTCKRCKGTLYWTNYMKQIKRHVEDGNCNNPACRVCNEK